MSRPLNRAHAYKSKEWLEMREHHLKIERYCRYCAELNMITRATHVDHVKPHRGDPELFLDKNNLQSLCGICHNAAKLKEETYGHAIGCDLDGWPRNERSLWNSGKLETTVKKPRVPQKRFRQKNPGWD